MKKYVWIVIAVVLVFLGAIITYTLGPAEGGGSGEPATTAGKPH